MRTFCRYALVEVETACLLVCGQKWKSFENSPVRYVKSGIMFFVPFRNITEYFRELEINGRRCVIIYWANERAKKGKLYNVVRQRGWSYFCLRGRCYSLDKIDYRATYRRLLDSLGVW